MTDLTFDPELTELVTELRNVRNQKHALEEAEKGIRGQILAALQQAGATRGFLASGEPAVRISEFDRTGVNRAKLEALFPDIFEQVKTSTHVVTLNLD